MIKEKEQKILDNFDSIIQNIKPLNSKQLLQLPYMIKDLSHQLTDERSSRHNSYMNQTVTLSAYTRYFMWWNLFRLTKVFSTFPTNSFDNLTDGDYCLDIGSGPLTVPISLWLTHPELRKKKLVWYCMDISQTALALGEEIFLSVIAQTTEFNDLCDKQETKTDDVNWKIIRVKGEIGSEIRNKASLITCANMFNELYYDSNKPLEEQAKKYTQILLNYGNDKSSVLVIEPASPRSSRFISLTRDALIRKELGIIEPCPHQKECPMDGRRGGKWCHFVFETEDAPKKLHKLSELAGLPKDRAALSYVFAQKNYKSLEDTKQYQFRIASDPIRIPGKGEGRYACSKFGLCLLMNYPKIKSGDLISIEKSIVGNIERLFIDNKSGAKIIFNKLERRIK